MARLLVLILVLVLMILTACGTDTITQPSDVSFPDTNVRFRGHVQPFLAVTCATGGCHADINAAGGIRLTSYSTIMFDRPNLVVPERPDESLLIQVLNGTFAHPIGNLATRVTSDQIRGMRQWITEGAKNN